MNSQAILALISDLYVQIAELRAQNEALIASGDHAASDHAGAEAVKAAEAQHG